MISRRRHKIKKKDVDNLLTCKPLDSYSEILLFLENPPPWRSLCKEITPHSSSLIRNVEINGKYNNSIETPENFCHHSPDVEDVKRYNSKSLRKTLVCHDMANGYHDDSIIDGTVNYDSYTFYNWAGIDIFCYFSHHLITIPPLGWINVAHAHGVKVIGTVITEWAEGITFWEQVLASEVEYQNLASALVAIAKTLKFDGWLLNIENKISKPEVLLEFVAYFHRLLHEELKDAVLLWYDSVTIQGNLNWQNGLNAKNKAFFDVCDGFFTNYSWSPTDVTSSAELADERVTDLYIGIDVWGRNFYGGGQFNTQEAIKVAYYAGCSLAIFAPAWTYEAMSEVQNDPNNVAMSEHLDKFGKCQLRDRAFWGSIWPFLNTRVPCELPFQTSFCRGQGKMRRLYGEVLCPSPWYNLRHQQYQPNSVHGPHCFILSTADKLIKVSRESHYKDKKGIIRYRSSFQVSRQELHAPTVKYSDTSDMREDDGEDESITTDTETTKPEKKMKMSKALKNFFAHKGKNIVFDENTITTINTDTRTEDTKIEPVFAENAKTTVDTDTRKKDTKIEPVFAENAKTTVDTDTRKKNTKIEPVFDENTVTTMNIDTHKEDTKIEPVFDENAKTTMNIDTHKEDTKIEPVFDENAKTTMNIDTRSEDTKIEPVFDENAKTTMNIDTHKEDTKIEPVFDENAKTTMNTDTHKEDTKIEPVFDENAKTTMNTDMHKEDTKIEPVFDENATTTMNIDTRKEDTKIEPVFDENAKPTVNTIMHKAVTKTESKSGEVDAGASSSGVYEPSGRIMKQLSMHLRLGASTENKIRYGLAHVSDERECLELYFDDAFTGGACLKVNPSDAICPDHRLARLFFCDFACEDTLIFCVVTKTLIQYSDQSLNVNLYMKNSNNKDLKVVLTGRSVTQSARLDKSSSGIKYVYPLNTSSEDMFRDLRTYLLIQQPGFYVPVENAYNWAVRYYQVTVPGSSIKVITLRTGLPQGGILLGHFGICCKIQQPEASRA